MPAISKRAAAVSGVATADIQGHGGRVQITIDPSSASGTGTITAKTFASSGFETVYDSAGAALTSISLSSQVSYIIDGVFDSIKVASSNAADAFDVIVSA